MKLNLSNYTFILVSLFFSLATPAAADAEVAPDETEPPPRASQLSVNVERTDFEGTYSITTEQGTRLSLNIIHTRRQRIALGLSYPEQGSPVSFAFYQVAYDQAGDYFVGSYRLPSMEAERNWWVQFRVNSQNQIHGRIYVAAFGFQEFTGHRVQTYENFFGPRVDRGLDIRGRYTGQLRCSGSAMNVELGIMEFPDGKLNGTFSLVNGQGRNARAHSIAEFQLGNGNPGTGTIYLTRSPAKTQTFTHIRGQLEGDRLRGEFIHGGIGRVCEPFVWTKVQGWTELRQ